MKSKTSGGNPMSNGSYVAACGAWFGSLKYMMKHEKLCPMCADIIAQEDEDHREEYDDEREDKEE